MPFGNILHHIVDNLDPVPGIFHIIRHASGICHIICQIHLPCGIHPHLKDIKGGRLCLSHLFQQPYRSYRPLQIRRNRICPETIFPPHHRSGIVRINRAGTYHGHIDRIVFFGIKSGKSVLNVPVRPYDICHCHKKI